MTALQTIAPAGPYPHVSSAPPRDWHETRYAGAVPRATATRTVEWDATLRRATRAYKELGWALSANSSELRRAVDALRRGVDEYRYAGARWNGANAAHYLAQIRQARTLHSKMIRRALAVAKEMQS